jgi:hypothetical protein
MEQVGGQRRRPRQDGVRYTGEDLSSLTLSDINDLEQQLEFSVNKVRTRNVLTMLPVYCNSHKKGTNCATDLFYMHC